MKKNNVLIIDIDTERKDNPIIVAHGNRNGDDISPTDEGYNIVSDMASLCEALCLMIHTAEQENIKHSAKSLRDCIHHLTEGFADASYFGKLVIK